MRFLFYSLVLGLTLTCACFEEGFAAENAHEKVVASRGTQQAMVTARGVAGPTRTEDSFFHKPLNLVKAGPPADIFPRSVRKGKWNYQELLFERPVGDNQWEVAPKNQPIVSGLTYRGLPVRWIDQGGGFNEKLVQSRETALYAALDALDYKHFAAKSKEQWCQKTLAFKALSGATLPGENLPSCLATIDRGIRVPAYKLEAIYLSGQSDEATSEKLSVALTYVADTAECLLRACGSQTQLALTRFSLEAYIELHTNNRFEVRVLMPPLVLTE